MPKKKTKSQPEPELAPVAREPVKEPEPTKPPVIKVKRWLAHTFTKDDLASMGQELAQTNQRIVSLEKKLNGVKTSIKADITQAENRRAELTEGITNAYEMRDVWCLVERHKPENGKKTITREDTCEVVCVEEMSAHEMQEQLPLSDDEDADEDGGGEDAADKAAEKAEAKVA